LTFGQRTKRKKINTEQKKRHEQKNCAQNNRRLSHKGKWWKPGGNVKMGLGVNKRQQQQQGGVMPKRKSRQKSNGSQTCRRESRQHTHTLGNGKWGGKSAENAKADGGSENPAAWVNGARFSSNVICLSFRWPAFYCKFTL